MPRTEHLIPPSEAIDIVVHHVEPLPLEQVPLDQAGDRVLAEPLISDQDLPPFPAATMDGFAVIADDISPWREIIGDQFAGTIENIEITPGTTARITTGAPIPKGADAVIPVEDTELMDDHVIIHQEHVQPGACIRPVGADLRAGEVLIETGTVIGPAEVGLLASLGRVQVPVARRPKVSIVATGNEIIDPAQHPDPGQIRDSNSFSLTLAAARVGTEIVWSGRAPDDQDTLRNLLIERIAESDVVITSGGVSMGEKDLVKGLLEELGTVHFRKLFMKPGKPLNFATAGRTLVFGLPGNPVSALVGFELFVHTALKVMTGRKDARPRFVPVRIDQTISSGDRPEFQRSAVWADDTGMLRARNTGSQSSARLMSFVGANALVLISPREEPYQIGEQVPAIIVGPIANAPVSR